MAKGKKKKSIARTHPAGEGVVLRSDLSWGHDRAEYLVPEHAEYVATSNAVYAAATLRARLLSTLKTRVMRNEREISRGPVRSLLDSVNPHWTWTRLIYQTELSLCLWGESFLVIDRGGREIWWVKPTQMRPVPHPTEYIAGYLFEGPDGTRMSFSTDEVVWLRYPNPLDEFSGLSPMAAARLAADVESASAKSNRNIFANGLQIGGWVSPKGDKTFSLEQAKDIEQALTEGSRGADKAHRWGVFRTEVGLQAANLTPKDAEWLGGLEWSLAAVARAMGVPRELLGGERSDLTYSTFEYALEAFWELTLGPEALFLGQELTEQLVPKIGGADSIEFDLREIKSLRKAVSAQWERVLKAVEAGVLSVEGAGRILGLDPADVAEKKQAPQAPVIPFGPSPSTQGAANGNVRPPGLLSLSG